MSEGGRVWWNVLRFATPVPLWSRCEAFPRIQERERSECCECIAGIKREGFPQCRKCFTMIR